MTTSLVSELMKKTFSEKSKTVKTRKDFRFLFFDTFPVSFIVPVQYYTFFRKISSKFYDKNSEGYNGIMAEIDDRIEISLRTGKQMRVNDFLKHTDKETDLYDPSIKKAIEKKTGCGDWLIDKNATTLEKALTIYRRKRRLIRWDYVYTPVSEDMNGQKSYNVADVEKGIKTAPERTKTKKDGTKVVNKQYAVNIHIETTYSKLFDYMETYPAGIATFFKLSTRTDDEGNTSYVWQMQTIKNSKKKIDFLEHFNTWIETGLSLDEYRKMKEEEE